MEQFKLPDPKKTSGRFLKFALFAGVGLTAWYYLVPFLVTMVWNTLSLGVGAVCLAAFLMIFTSKTFWKRLDIILQALGSLMFGFFVEMNPWNILKLQLEEMRKDLQELRKEKEKLEAQDSSLTAQLSAEDKNMQVASESMNIVQRKLRTIPSDDAEYELVQMELESCTNEYNSSKDFIDSVAPISGDIKKLIKYAEKGYIKGGYVIKDTETSITKQKAAYDAVMAGSNAMQKLSKVFFGDPEMNNAATIARKKIEALVATNRGIIKNSIKETSKFMNERDLRDAAKVSLAVKNMEALQLEDKAGFNYVDSQRQTSTLPSATGNRWLNELK